MYNVWVAYLLGILSVTISGLLIWGVWMQTGVFASPAWIVVVGAFIFTALVTKAIADDAH